MQQAKALHIFKPGQFMALTGQCFTFSESDLRATAQAYNAALHEAPLTVGHPQHDLPAYGWVQSLAYHEGDDEAAPGLYAVPAQVNPAFADMVAAGAFKKISAAFYPPDSPSNPSPGSYYLRHVGFLGAQPPAVKGLRNPAFSDAEGADVLAFSEELSFPTETTQESTVTETEAAALRAENDALKAAAAKAAADQRHAANLAFCESLVGEGRLLSAAVPVLVATLDHLAAAEQPIEFGEGDAKAPLLDQLMAQLKAAPKLVNLGETATAQRAASGGATSVDTAEFGEGADPVRLAQHQAIKAYAEQHKVSYEAAAIAVLK